MEFANLVSQIALNAHQILIAVLAAKDIFSILMVNASRMV